MEEIHVEILRTLERKEKAALATLITRVGSAPRGVGAKFLVKEDGTSFGSIGGGCVEAEVWQEAQEVIRNGRAGVLHFNLTAEQLAQGGLICGGNVDIFLEPLREEFLKIYENIVRIRQKGGAAVLATLISVDDHSPEGADTKVLIRTSGEKVGSLIGGESLDRRILQEGESLLREKSPRVISALSDANAAWKKMDLLVEPVFSEPVVYIFGAGHVSRELAPLAKRVSFKVVVIDDRDVFANRERFPEADDVVVSEFEHCFDRLKIDESSYIVIVTRGHLYDGYVLEQAVKTQARYIGMIGSKKKIRILFRNLTEKGILRETLERVYAPIGLDINSETPEEIAVSIVAQMIKVRGEAV
jgi:xanthine dehydrogenase accessory factor